MHPLLFPLFLLLLASCGRPAPTTEPDSSGSDSMMIAHRLNRQLLTTEVADSIGWYVEQACRYVSQETSRAYLYYNAASRSKDLGDVVQATAYYQEAGRGGDTWLQERLCRELPLLYADQGRYAEAARVLDSIRDCRRSRELIPHYLLARGNLFAVEGRRDSALHYYEQASRSLNRWVATMALRRMQWLYAGRGEDSLMYRMALNADGLLIKEIEKEVYAGDRQNYEQEKTKNELNRLKISKQQREIQLLTLGLCFVLILSLVCWQMLRRKRQADRLLLREKTIRLEQANQLLVQAEELAQLREKESQLRESLFRRMKSFHKIPSLEEAPASEGAEESTRRIALSVEEWEEIRQTVDKSYDNFTARLRRQFPSLTEKDINFCCLVKIGVSIKDLSDIYCISRTSVSRKKLRLKKEKLGVTTEDETLDSFLRRF